MASVIKSNVMINVNGAQAVAGLNQVTAATRQVGGGMNNLQQVTQNLAYAADDAVASFGTGGLAGALRGAGNNLTLVAGLLGGVKAQLLAVAAIGIGGFLASQWQRAKKATEGAKASLEDYGRALRDISKQRIGGALELRQGQREIARETDLNSIRGRQRAGRDRLGDLEFEQNKTSNRLREVQRLRDRYQNEVNRLESVGGANLAIENMLNPAQGRRYEEFKGRLEELKKENDELVKSHREIATQIEQQKELNMLTSERVEEVRKLDKIHQILAINQELADLREKQAAQRGITADDAFGSFARAERFGSTGAVSTINAARFGSQNIQDAGLQVDRDQLETQRRIERLLRDKRIIETVVGV